VFFVAAKYDLIFKEFQFTSLAILKFYLKMCQYGHTNPYFSIISNISKGLRQNVLQNGSDKNLSFSKSCDFKKLFF